MERNKNYEKEKLEERQIDEHEKERNIPNLFYILDF